MAEGTEKTKKKSTNRPKKLTAAAIKREIEKLQKLFEGIEDEDKKTLVNSVIEEAAFLKVACLQAKEEMKKEGLTTKPKTLRSIS